MERSLRAGWRPYPWCHRDRKCEHICRELCGNSRIHAAWWRRHRKGVDRMLNLLLILAALTGLPALTEVGRLLMIILARLIGLAFVMALLMIILLALTTHGKVIL